jgi:predicted kinase
MSGKVYILSGISGCGKSTFAKRKAMLEGAVICSADDFFCDPETGEYKFDPTKLAQAHAWCMERFLHNLQFDAPIVVDNTNIERWQWENYDKIAKMIGREVEHHAWMVSTLEEVVTCNRRNKHGVPLAVAIDMAIKHAIVGGARIHAIETVDSGAFPSNVQLAT